MWTNRQAILTEYFEACTLQIYQVTRHASRHVVVLYWSTQCVQHVHVFLDTISRARHVCDIHVENTCHATCQLFVSHVCNTRGGLISRGCVIWVREPWGVSVYIYAHQMPLHHSCVIWDTHECVSKWCPISKPFWGLLVIHTWIVYATWHVTWHAACQLLRRLKMVHTCVRRGMCRLRCSYVA